MREFQKPALEAGGGGKEVGDGEVKRVIYSQKLLLFFFFSEALAQVGGTAETLEGGGREVSRFKCWRDTNMVAARKKKKKKPRRIGRAVKRGEPRKQNKKNSPKSGGYLWRRRWMFHTAAPGC